MPTAPRISSSVFRAAACAQRGTPGSASVSPTPDESDCRSIEGHSHVPTGVTPRIGGIAVAVAKGSVCPDSIRRAYRPTKGVSGSHTWCLMRGGEKLWRARLPLPFIGQFNPRLCFFYPADSEKAGPSAVSSTCDATTILPRRPLALNSDGCEESILRPSILSVSAMTLCIWKPEGICFWNLFGCTG